MKTMLMACLMSLSLGALAAPVTARVDQSFCGEMDPFVVGDACLVQVTKLNGQRLGMLFDLADFGSQFAEGELDGAMISVDEAQLSRIRDAATLRVLQRFSRDYFYMRAEVTAIAKLNAGPMEAFAKLVGSDFSETRLPFGYRAVKLPRLAAKGAFKKFLADETKTKKKLWEGYVLTSGEYDHLSLAERRRIAADPFTAHDSKDLLPVVQVFAIYKGSQLIGHFVELNDLVQSSLYQDGAWIELFLDLDQNLVRRFDESA